MKRRITFLSGGALLVLLVVVGLRAFQQPPAASLETPPESATAQQVIVPAAAQTQPPEPAAITPTVDNNPASVPAASVPVTPAPASPIPATTAPILPPVPTVSIIQPPIPVQPVANQVVITFHPGTSPEQQQVYLKSIGATVVQSVGALNTIVANVPPSVAAQPLPPSPAVAASEPDYFAVALEAPVNDLLYEQQWALPVIGAPEGWALLPSDASSVAVAVVDSGVCADHPELVGRVLPGYDFVDGDAVAQDAFGHGCNVAGVIAANGNNGLGIAGVAPNAQILPVRVLNAQGIGTYSDVAAGIVYAADHGAQIINLSLGGGNPSSVLRSAVDYAVSKGALVVAAAGNTGGAVLYPAAYAPVVAVASVDSNLQRSSFSSYGPEVDLLAPGRDILTTSADGSYRIVSGTSFAAPQVAGVAALEIGLGRTLSLDGGIVKVVGNGDSATPTATTTLVDITSVPTSEISPQPTETWAEEYSILSNGQFVYGPNVDDFRVVTYLNTSAPHLAIFAEELYGRSEYYSINPRVYLTLIQITSGLVLNDNPSNDILANPFGLPEPGFIQQVDRLSEVMFSAYYSRIYIPVSEQQTPPEIILADGTLLQLSANTNAATYALVRAMALVFNSAQMKIALDNNHPEGFYQTYHHLFPDDDPLSESNHIYVPGEIGYLAAPAGLLQFPYLQGESWKFNGVHDALGGGSGSPGTDMSSIDFSPGWPAWNADTNNMWAVAAAGGTPIKISNCNVRVNHSDGWQTAYYHLENVQSFGSTINQNDKIGVLANTTGEALCNGGSSTGPHIHFTLKRNGAYVALDSTAFAGWAVHSGRNNYDTDHNYMWFERGSERKYVGDWLQNSSSPTDTTPPDGNFTSPSNGASVTKTVFLSGTASDASGIREVRFTAQWPGQGWKVIYTDTSAPYEYLWDLCASGVPNGGIELGFDITDNAGNVRNSPNGTRTITKSGSCTGEMKLYSQVSYGGSLLFSSNGGFSNDPAANSYSMLIPNGWSVKTWRADNGSSSGAEERCWSSSVTNLQDHGWQNSIQSIEVFTSNVCSPPPSSDVRLCRTDDGNDCTAFPIGSDSNLTDNGLNDQVRSVRVPSGKSLFVFNDENFRNSADCYTSDRIPLPIGSPWDIRGQVTSTVILNQGGCPWSQVNSVVLFETNNFSGAKLGVGSYPHWENIPQLNSYFNDKVVSIHIPAGLSVYLWEHDNRTEPRTACLTGDIANLGSMAGKASSIEVFPNTSCQPAVPVVPANLHSTSVTETGITLGWNDGANEDGYKIYKWSVVNDVWDFYYLASVGANVTSYTDTGLNCAGMYHYQVSAYNGGGESGRTAFISTTTANCTAPPVPANLHSTNITSDSITVGWNDGTNETGYKIYKWSVVNDVWDFYYLASVGANVTSYTDTGLNCAGVYHYQISAYNSNGESGRTAFISETTANCTAPPVPENLHATTITSSSITIGWNDGANETGYKIYKWSEVGGVWDFYYLASVGANVTSYTDTSLNCAGIYHYEISAYNNTGESERTGWIQVIAAACTDTAPPNGTMTTPGRQSFQAGPIVTLQANAWDDASGVNRVEFYWWTGSTWELLGSDNSSPYEMDWDISGVSEGFLWASAKIFDNAGNNSGILVGDTYWTYFTIDRTPPMSAVNALLANQTGLSFTVTWSGSDVIAGSDYLLYDVQFQENCTGDWYDWVVMDSVTGATFYGDWSQQYCFRSRAYDPAGNVEDWPDTADASTRALEDTTAPTGYFTMPLAYTSLNSSEVTGWLEASDAESGLSHVIFFVGYDDGLGAASLSMDVSPPIPDEATGQDTSAQGWDWHQLNTDSDDDDGWSFTWDATGVPDQTGTIKLFAYVYDRVGNNSWTRIDGITLDRAAPTGNMAAPLRNSHQKGPVIPLRADVADATSGVSKVRFFGWSMEPWSNQEWILLGEDTTSPFEYNWSPGSITDGQVYVTAEVTDFAGNSVWLWGDSEWMWMFVDRTPPVSSVDSLPATQETNEFVVTWNGADNFTDGNYLRYDVQYQLDCTGSWLNWHSQIEGVQAGLFTGVYGHSYCFRSRAYDAAGNVEAWPSAADTTTRVRDPLAAPTALTPANNAKVGRFDPITLSWNPVSGATGYSVEFWGSNGVALASDWITEPSWTIPAQVGGQYQWHVKARDAIMESNWSATQNLGVRYGPPADLTITAHNSYQVVLAWTPSVDAPDRITGYYVDAMIGGNVYRHYTVGASATTFLASGLECETDYTLVVRAYKGSLESDNSNTAAVTLTECSLPAPVLYSPSWNSSSSDRQPYFSWSSRQYATGYEIQIGMTDPPTTTPIALNSTYYYPPSPLLTTTYYWRVRSVRNSRTSDWSSTWVFTVTSPASAAPTRNLFTTATPTLSWGQLPWALAYQVEWSTTSAFNYGDWYYKRLDVPASTLSVPTDPLPDGAYYWRVRAQKADGTWSGWSAIESFTIDVP